MGHVVWGLFMCAVNARRGGAQPGELGELAQLVVLVAVFFMFVMLAGGSDTTEFIAVVDGSMFEVIVVT